MILFSLITGIFIGVGATLMFTGKQKIGNYNER
jgi:hypothetical protein